MPELFYPASIMFILTRRYSEQHCTSHGMKFYGNKKSLIVVIVNFTLPDN
jgi:hypothetical protein